MRLVPRDQDGRTSFLLIDAGGYATARSAEFVVRERMPNLTVELIPEVPAPVRGRLVDQAGKAVEGARVRRARFMGTSRRFRGGSSTRLGTTGTSKSNMLEWGTGFRSASTSPAPEGQRATGCHSTA